MNFLQKVKNWIGNDAMQNYWWLDAKVHDENWTESKELRETCVIKGINKCNLLLAEDVNLCIEGDFSGIVIGKKNNKVRIAGKFAGAISCDILNCTSSAVVNANPFVNHLSLEDGAILNGETNLGKHIYEKNPIRASDLGKLTPLDFEERYI